MTILTLIQEIQEIGDSRDSRMLTVAVVMQQLAVNDVLLTSRPAVPVSHKIKGIVSSSFMEHFISRQTTTNFCFFLLLALAMH